LLEQNVPHASLRHTGWASLAAAPFVEPQDMKAVAAAQNGANLALFYVFQGVVKHRRQPIARAPPHETALQRIRRLGVSRRHLAEIDALGDLGERGLCVGAPRL